MTLFQFAAVFLSLVALVGWLNVRLLRLPTGVAMMGAGVIGAVGLFALQATVASFSGFDAVRDVIAHLNFTDAVLGYMLAFLLFAGGMQVDLRELRRRIVPVVTLATVGVLASIVLVGFGLHAVAGLLGINFPLAWSFVFASLISPTDPVAVLDIVKTGGLSRRIAAVLQGEALLNDGVGIVAFGVTLAFALHGSEPGVLRIGGLVLLEAGGGLALGWIAGRLVVWSMRAVDDYVVEATASLALAAGVYALGQALHLSGAIAAATAGVVVGSYGVKHAMSDRTQAYVQAMWTLIDEILNAALFLLLGLQIFVLRFDVERAGFWLSAALLVLAARLAVVLPWGAWFHFKHEERGPSLVMAWGGMRGAISLALALSIPRGPAHEAVATLTFVVVSLSVLVQGLTFGTLTRLLGASGDDDGEDGSAPPHDAAEKHVRETLGPSPSLAGDGRGG